ncbi:metallophosphoesterase family protein [soil metagenome]
MSVLLQISDPHFGTERREVAAALQRFANALHPDVVLVSGDITQRAKPEEFATARAFMDSISARTKMSIPGNHDIPLYNVLARFITPYSNYRRSFGSELEPVHESGDLLLIGLNTTHPRRHKDGKLSASQIERVAGLLKASRPEQLRIVALHHPMFVTREQDIENLVHGHEAAALAWSAAGADLVIGGHIHLPYVRSLREIHARLPRPMWAVQAGTAVSRRVRGDIANSVNVVRCTPLGSAMNCVVERWDYNRPSDSFKVEEVHRLQLDRTT